jgi:hypothetical protein
MPSLSTSFTADKTIKYDPARSVLQYKPGDNLSLTSDGFARLAAAFLAGIERKYVATQRQMPPVPAARRRQFHHVRFRVPS